jgi:hypothetical protein
MRRTFLTLALLSAGFGLGVSPASAQKPDPYAWCAEYGGGRGGATNCYFVTYQQCQWAISGNGGFCRPNPFYTGPGPQYRRRPGYHYPY